MAQATVTVVIPTLAADEALADCLDSLRVQTRRDFEIIVVDNGGRGFAFDRSIRIISNARNVGFGAAVNQGVLSSTAPYVATLNDDAVADPNWIANLLQAVEGNERIGMCASQVRLSCKELDSAGLCIARDGSSKQRGHRQPPEAYASPIEVLCPSGSAALYRRKMLEETGGFDEDFFLYCEDTDLGLRARRAGWTCVYVPDAVVEHRYSYSAGRASPLKAYYVERNRIYVAVKNFPLPSLALVPFASALRYFWHAVSILRAEGAAAEFRREHHGGLLLWFVVKAHLAALAALPALLGKRRKIALTARLSTREYRDLLRAHTIPLRQVASL